METCSSSSHSPAQETPLIFSNRLTDSLADTDLNDRLFTSPSSPPSAYIKLMGDELGLARARREARQQSVSSRTQRLAEKTDFRTLLLNRQDRWEMKLQAMQDRRSMQLLDTSDDEELAVVTVRELNELRASKAKLEELETAMRKAEEDVIEDFWFKDRIPRYEDGGAGDEEEDSDEEGVYAVKEESLRRLFES